MAKRKLPTTHTPSRKRVKARAQRTPLRNNESPVVEVEREWKVRTILEENKNRYLIAWADDEETGQQYSPTWEPKAFANQLAVDDWERQKAAQSPNKPVNGTRRPRITLTLGHRSTTSSPAQKPKDRQVVQERRESRLRRTIISSPEDQSSLSSEKPSTQDSAGQISLRSDTQSGIATNSLLVGSLKSPSNSQKIRQPDIHLPELPSSYLAGAYDTVSSESEHQARSSPDQHHSFTSYSPQSIGQDLPSLTRRSQEPISSVRKEVERLEPLRASSARPLFEPRERNSSSGRVIPDSQGPSLPTFATREAAFTDRNSDPSDDQIFAYDEDQTATPDIVPSPCSGASSSRVNARIIGSSLQTTHAARKITEAEVVSPNFESHRSRKERSPSRHPEAQNRATSSARSAISATCISERSHHIHGRSDEVQQSSDPAWTRTRPDYSPRTSKELRTGDQAEYTVPRDDEGKQQACASRITKAALLDLLGRPAAVKAYREVSTRTTRAPKASENILRSTSELPRPTRASLPFQSQLPEATATAVSSSGVSKFGKSSKQRRGGTREERRTPLGPSLELQSDSSVDKRTQRRAHSHPDSHTEVSLLSPARSTDRSPDARSAKSTHLPQSRTKASERQRALQSIETDDFAKSLPPLPRTSSTPNPHRAMEQAAHSLGRPSDHVAPISEALRTSVLSKGQAIRSNRPPVVGTNPSLHSTLPPSLSSDSNHTISSAAHRIALMERGTRSPSAISAEEALPVITQEEQNTSERLDTLVPKAQVGLDTLLPRAQVTRMSVATDPDAINVSNGSEIILETTPTARSNEHVVPIILAAHQRDQYHQMVRYFQDALKSFLEARSVPEVLLEEVQTFLFRLRNVLIHPDLDNGETETQYNVTPSQQADWDVNCSAKFRFLKAFMQALRTQDIHIAIVTPLTRVKSILDVFMQGLKIPCQSLSKVNDQAETAQSALRVTLVSANDDEEAVSKLRPNLIIVLDPKANDDNALLARLMQSPSEAVPFLTLVVPLSIEHIELSLPARLSGVEHSKTLVKAILEFKNQAGKRSDGQLTLESAASAIAEYMASTEVNANWPIADLKMIEDLDKQIKSAADLAENSQLTSIVMGTKRSRPSDSEPDATEAAKKQRFDLLDTQDTSNEITHVSDSIVNATAESNMHVKNDRGPSIAEIEARFEDLLSAAQERTEEHVRELNDLQYRCEEQYAQLSRVTQERDEAASKLLESAGRFSEQANQLSTMRVENRSLREKLNEANDRLKDHSIPDRAEVERLRLTIDKMNVENEKLATKLKSAEDQLEYVRKQYQDSSNKAQALNMQAEELKTNLESARALATGQQAKLRQMSYDAFTKNLQSENSKLKRIGQDRDAALKLRDDEIARLKEAGRGRMGTRGSSVPRSSRNTSPTTKVNSRQGSPAAGDLRGRMSSSLLQHLRNS